jgi:DNA polymerase-3 subunit delta'
MRNVLAFAQNPRFENTRARLALLSKNPPQSLLLEGGSAIQRLSASLYWAALLNCSAPVRRDNTSAPCLACPACLQFVNLMHRDLFFFDGSAKSITIEDIRTSGIRSSLGESPASATYRIVLFYEAHAFNDVSANAFLKALEEPQLATLFILTAPQREKLLQTLVSRSWVLTLPWPDKTDGLFDDETHKQISELSGYLLDFATGKNCAWLERVNKKGEGAIDKYIAMRLVLLCQKALLQSLGDSLAAFSSLPPTLPSTLPEEELARSFASLPPERQHIVNEALAECQDCLGDNLKTSVNPALVLNWLATRLFFVFKNKVNSKVSTTIIR